MNIKKIEKEANIKAKKLKAIYPWIPMNTIKDVAIRAYTDIAAAEELSASIKTK